MPALKQIAKRLRDRWVLPPAGSLSVRDLFARFPSTPVGSTRSLCMGMDRRADSAEPIGGSLRPYYTRRRPAPRNPNSIASNTNYIDFTNSKTSQYGAAESEAVRLFDERAAVVVSAAVGLENGINLRPSGKPETEPTELLEQKDYDGKAPSIFIPKAKCLAILAYPDFFPEVGEGYRSLVSDAILLSSPGWCGSFGPGVDSSTDVADLFGKHQEGNYDMSQMHLLRISYRYYDQLTPAARNLLIEVLFAQGRIRRPNEDDTFTSEGVPNDWSRAGFAELPIPLIDKFIKPKITRIGETENHILTIHTARYLTNQLLYQRDHGANHDNRRNGSSDAPSCTELMLALLRNILRDDFSEYNSKNYQNEVLSALLNLCSYAYDHEVRLGARMVLDYISAHVAVSSNDLRRMIPFRRRNEGVHSATDADGFMTVGLLETSSGADPMAQHFAMLAGNIRIYERISATRPVAWRMNTAGENGNEALADALSDYRLPVPIQDLLVTDLHRRFFQRLHRTPLAGKYPGQDTEDEPAINGRNCDNYEIYSSSPSYLITAGGSPADYAIDPRVAGIALGDQAQQLGVAVTTSFIPTTGFSDGSPLPGALDKADEVIQFSSFSDAVGGISNYGVAPDFACGHKMHSPAWCTNPPNGPNDRIGSFRFVNCGSTGGHPECNPGFYLAIYQTPQVAVLEAYDTWLHPHALTFEQFKSDVARRNGSLNVTLNKEADYYTWNGSHVRFVIWDDIRGFGARIVRIDYGSGDPEDALGDAGNDTEPFLRGTVMNSRQQGVVEITNHSLGQKLILDMYDQAHPRRTDENGKVEAAGSNQEVWVNFGYKGPCEGDFFRPFNTLEAAAAAVAEGGVIKIMPGWTTERPKFARSKRFTLTAPSERIAFGVW